MFVTLKWADSQSGDYFDNNKKIKQIFLFFVFHELDIWNVSFITNIYQAIGSKTTGLFMQLPQNVPSLGGGGGDRSSQNTGPNCGVA